MAVLWFLHKVVCLTIVVLMVFFEKVLAMIATIAALIGWIIFGISVLSAVVMFIQGGTPLQNYLAPAIVAFMGFALPYIVFAAPGVLMAVRMFLVEDVLKA